MLVLARLLAVFIAVATSAVLADNPTPVLDSELAVITEIAADLSLITFFEFPDNRDGYDIFEVYTDEPDRAILAATEGYCFVAFRGADLSNPADVLQNVKPGLSKVCPDGTTKNCCKTKTGLRNAYFEPDFLEKLQTDLATCMGTCADPDNCVVFTGFSQGGSIAQVAGIVYKSVNPYVIAFANEKTLNPECDQVSDETRWFRYINTRETDVFGRINYDPIPLKDNDRGLVNFGYTLLLSEDDTGVATVGLSNDDDNFRPFDLRPYQRSHRINTDDDDANLGYRNRIQILVARDSFPIRSNGFAEGFPCSRKLECESGRCKRKFFFSRRQCVA